VRSNDPRPFVFAACLKSCFTALLLLAASGVEAQLAGTGNIQGTVADTTGAVVANATVTLTNVATAGKRTTLTDGAGVYLFPNINIGNYQLQVSAPSFKTYVQTGIVLEVGSNIAINPVLAIGATDTKVEVHADALALQTEDSTFKQTIDQADMQEMPLNGREMAALITLSGGSSTAPSGDFTGSKYSYQTIAVSVAGGMGNTTEWKLDGGDNNEYMANGNLPFPFPDAVAQFSVESTALNPENTLHSGGLVNVVTKSGTSTYHGSAFEFIRNNYLDATNFFASSKDQLHQNQFGGTFGGPVIPWKHKQLFAFAAYQRWLESSASSVNTQYVPTAANLQGNWATTDPPPGAAANSCGSPQQLYDPLTGNAIPGNVYPTAPSYNPQALKLDTYLPSSSSSPDVSAYDPNCGTVKFSIPTEYFDNQFVTRVDWSINPKNNFYARYFIDGYQAPSFFSAHNVLITFQAPGNYERVQTATAALATTITSNLINSFHVSGTKRVDNRASAPGINGNSVGITMYNQVPSNLQVAVSTSGKNHGWDSYCGTCSPGFFNVSDESFSDDLTWVHGAHQIVVGGEYVRVQFNEVAAYEADGLFDFNGEFSGSGPVGGNVYGDANLDFLWGAMNSFQQSKEDQLAMRGPIPSLYAVDTFHVSKRLTLVGGVRWAPEFFPHDYFNRGTVFNLADFLADNFSTVYPTAPPGILFYGDPGVTKAYTKNSAVQFNPNVGVTWDPFGNGNTVVRGGLGLIYDEANYYTSNRMHLNPPFATVSSPNISGPICFSEPWLVGGTGYGCAQVGGTNTSPYPQPTVPTPAEAQFPAQGQYIELPSQFRDSDTFQWTFSVQHEFRGGWQAQADYIGNKTSNMPIGTPLNPAVYTPGVWGAGGTGCGPVQTSGAAAAAAKTVGGGAVGTACSTTGNSQARFALVEANPQYGNLLGGGGYNGSFGGTASNLINDDAWANYNGLVLTLQHRLSSTFSMLSNYTWSKCLNIADAGGDVSAVSEEDPYNLALDYGRCGSDYRNIFNTTLVVKSAFKSLRGLGGYLANDWELAPLFHIASGSPINVTDAADISLTDIGEDRPNAVSGINPVHEVKILNSTTATQATREYINAAAYCSVASSFNPCTNPVTPGTFGDVGRNSVNGPMFFQFDSQVSRIWRMGERFSLDTRLEAFNVLNHPNFANPSSSNPSSSAFGLITGEAGGVGNPVTSFYQRLFQGAVKVIF
jgi:Carboxypeptidase regulatory-like domain